MHHIQKDEEELQGSSDAALYDRYGSAIFAYVRLHTASREDAEDLTLEVFTAALEHDNLPGFSSREQLAWLRRVAHNKLVDSYRRATRHPTVALESIEALDLQDGDCAVDPERAALEREERGQLLRAISGLSKLQQQVLRLRYGADLSFGEIAQLLNRREAAIRKMLSRTLTALRSSYRERQS